MLELISHERFRQRGIPVDIGPYHNHGAPSGAGFEQGTVADESAITFPHRGSRVSISLGDDRQWVPLIALRIEVIAKINPRAARTLTLVEGDSAFRFGIMETALEAEFVGPPGAGTYVRSDSTYSPDGRLHAVPANRWVKLEFDHDGYSKMRLRIDGRLVGETTVSAGVPSVKSSGVSIGNTVAGGQPLLGAVDEIRIWRLYPDGVRKEFWCRHHTESTGRCWEAIFRAVREWGISHPAELAALIKLLANVERALLHKLFLLPEAEQLRVRRILKDYRRLWCEGEIDGEAMGRVLKYWVAELRGIGVDPTSTVPAELNAILYRASHDIGPLSLKCDWAVAAFLNLAGHALNQPPQAT